MNTGAMLARLNELDGQVCNALRITRSGDAPTLDDAITMSAVTAHRLLSGDRSIHEGIASSVAQRHLIAFLQAQVEARAMRDRYSGNVVRPMTEGIRRMKKAGSLQGLGRHACTDLRDARGVDRPLLPLVEDGGFLVEDSVHSLAGPTVIRRRGCVAEG